MIASALILAWAVGWIALIQSTHGFRDSLDAAALACLVVFPCLCVLAARYLP